MKRYICHDNETRVDAYYDGELSPEESLEYKSHLSNCPECVRSLGEYSSISGSLKSLYRRESEMGEGISLWPEIVSRIENASSFQPRKSSKKKLFLLYRPAWISLALSAAAALILFFSGVFQSDKLPSNYCRIDNISSPDHNYMIYQDRSDGLTIIWVME